MTQISLYMTEHHRACDQMLVEAEAPLAKKSWPEFNATWQRFSAELLQHFQAEEDVLFPQFEQSTGMTQGPTMVMRNEHDQMRVMLAQMEDAITSENFDKAAGIVESLMLFIQQHNMKEEQILYPMTDAHLSNSENIINDMSLIILNK